MLARKESAGTLHGGMETAGGVTGNDGAFIVRVYICSLVAELQQTNKKGFCFFRIPTAGVG